MDDMPAEGLQQQQDPATAEEQGEGTHEDDHAAKLAASKTQERQQQANRLATTYREETKLLMKELLKQQISWREDLQGSGVYVGVPSFQPPRGLTVRKRLSWRTSEREALKRLLFAHGVGKWKEIHTCLKAALPGFNHGAGDVEDACWQLLGELQLLLPSHDEHMYLAHLMEPVADKPPIYTPGPPFKLSAVSGGYTRRLRLLEDFNMLMPALQRSEAVAGYFRCLAGGLSPDDAPASWWDVEADVGLLVGLWRHGFNHYQEIRRDPDLVIAFQGYHSRHGQSTQAAGVNGSGSNPQQHEPDAEAASAAQQATTSWPPDDVLSQRVRTLFTLLAQAVVLAETQGLLMPLPGEGLGLSERLLQLPASVDFIEAGASFFHPSLFQEDPEGPLEDLLCADEASGSENSSDEDAAAQQAYAAYSARGRGRGRRGRGRGRSRTSKAERLAAEAAAFGAVIPTAAQPAAAEEEGDEGGFGRRRVQRPNSRYADSILLPVAVQERGSHDGPSGGGASAHHAAPSKEQASEVKGADLGKKHRREMLNLLFAWGPPAAKLTPNDAAAAAAGEEQELDWESWPGQVEMSAGLQQAGDEELTAIFKELTAEKDALMAAPGGKPRNAHAPTCDCIVCKNRRRAEERRQQEAAAGGAEGGGDAAAAAGGNADDDEEQQEGDAAAGGTEGKQQVKAETLNAMTASRLQERLELLATLQAGMQELPSDWHTQAKSTAAAKELLPWWTSMHDDGLVQGVLLHGYGNWVAMCEDEDLPFKSGAAHYGYDVDTAALQGGSSSSKASKGAKAAAAILPDWMPDAKALQKRLKSLAAAIKKMLTRAATVSKATQQQGKGGGSTMGEGPGGRKGGAAPPSMAPQQQQQQQQMRLPPPNPAAAAGIAQLAQQLGTGPPFLQALQAAAAQGNPALLAEFYRQQQAAQQQLLKQQQGLGASVLGKRGAAAAGLGEGSSRARGFTPPPPIDAAAAAAAGAGGGVGQPPSPESLLSSVRGMPLVRRDGSGAAVLPLVLSKDLMVISLGTVNSTSPSFHMPSHILPVGYIATCTYPSSVAQGANARYTTTIAEGSGGSSLFVVVAADAPGRQWVATTAAGVWQKIQVDASTVQQGGGVAVPAVDGVTQMGLNHPLVAMLVQELPRVQDCANFRPELSAAPPQLVAAIQQQQAAAAAAAPPARTPRGSLAAGPLPAFAAGGGGAAAAVAGGGSGLPPAQLAAAGMHVPQQQQALAAQLLQQQQHMAHGGQPAAATPQQQQRLLQLLQQRQAMQQQQQAQGHGGQVPGQAASVQQQQQQLMMQQQLMAHMALAQQQQGHPH